MHIVSTITREIGFFIGFIRVGPVGGRILVEAVQKGIESEGCLAK